VLHVPSIFFLFLDLDIVSNTLSSNTYPNRRMQLLFHISKSHLNFAAAIQFSIPVLTERHACLKLSKFAKFVTPAKFLRITKLVADYNTFLLFKIRVQGTGWNGINRAC
jgi:hypothetical protein